MIYPTYPIHKKNQAINKEKTRLSELSNWLYGCFSEREREFLRAIKERGIVCKYSQIITGKNKQIMTGSISHFVLVSIEVCRENIINSPLTDTTVGLRALSRCCSCCA